MGLANKQTTFTYVGTVEEVADDLCGVAEEWREKGGPSGSVNLGFDPGQNVFFAHVSFQEPVPAVPADAGSELVEFPADSEFKRPVKPKPKPRKPLPKKPLPRKPQ